MTPIPIVLRSRSGYFRRAPSACSFVLKGFDKGVNSPPTYLKSLTPSGLTYLSTHGTNVAMEFGQLLRQLRTKTGIGIKRLAPELHVSYTYLSKLENNE